MGAKSNLPLDHLLTPQLIAERDRLNKDLEGAHASIKALEGELETMAGSRNRR